MKGLIGAYSAVIEDVLLRLHQAGWSEAQVATLERAWVERLGQALPEHHVDALVAPQPSPKTHEQHFELAIEDGDRPAKRWKPCDFWGNLSGPWFYGADQEVIAKVGHALFEDSPKQNQQSEQQVESEQELEKQTAEVIRVESFVDVDIEKPQRADESFNNNNKKMVDEWFKKEALLSVLQVHTPDPVWDENSAPYNNDSDSDDPESERLERQRAREEESSPSFLAALETLKRDGELERITQPFTIPPSLGTSLQHPFLSGIVSKITSEEDTWTLEMRRVMLRVQKEEFFEKNMKLHLHFKGIETQASTSSSSASPRLE